MNKLFYITIPLLIANITFGLDCPNPTDKCRYRGKRFLPSDPNAPECWSFSYDRWQCTYKVDGKCDKAYGQIDITECNVPPPPPTPECPKATDTCKTGDILWKADSPNAPKCWTKNPSVQFGWICRGDSEDECDASKGEADLTNCNIKPPVPTPECPKATNKCKTGDVIWDANSPNAPKCWTKNPSVEFGWTCRGDSSDKCDASKGETDIKTCDIPPPPIPDCPKATDICYAGTESFKANDPNAPKCWSKSSSGGWDCLNGLNGKCDTTIGQLDIKTCKIPPPDPTSECPKDNDYCLIDDIAYFPTDPIKPKCWFKTPKGWSCDALAVTCDTSKGQFDIETCGVTPPIPIPECPKATNKCKTGDVIWDANSPNAPKCWTKNPSVEFGWTCRGNSGDKCDASKGETDIKTCNIPPPAPTPKCPKATDFCRNGIGSWRANDPYSPKCWSKTSSGWRCQGDSDAKCDTSKGEVDLKACNIPPPTPECPKATDSCLVGDIAYRADDPSAPKCWSKSSASQFGWSCYGSRFTTCDALRGEVDLGTCGITPPVPTPECPKATDSCLVGDIAYRASDSFAPKCWTKNPSVQFGWTCKGNSNTICDASRGEVDLSTCGITPPIPTPECPKATDSCKTGDILWKANSPNAPKCWTKNPSVQFGWTCQGNSNTICDASRGEVDLSTCGITPPVPTPECPKATDSCLVGDIAYRASDSFAPKCWTKNPSVQFGWTCKGNSNTICDASRGEVDLSTCGITPPIPTPECPKATDSCKTGDILWKADSPNAPKCWTRNPSVQFGWTCQGNSNTRCDFSRGEVDITMCTFPPVPPTPDCPKEKDYCRNGYSYFYASDLKAPACWRKTKLGWTCNWKKGYTCDKGEVDLTVCFPYRRRKCPKKNYDSYSHYGSGYGSGYKPGYNTPKPGYGSGYKPSYGSGYNPVYNPVYKGH